MPQRRSGCDRQSGQGWAVCGLARYRMAVVQLCGRPVRDPPGDGRQVHRVIWRPTPSMRVPAHGEMISAMVLFASCRWRRAVKSSGRSVPTRSVGEGATVAKCGANAYGPATTDKRGAYASDQPGRQVHADHHARGQERDRRRRVVRQRCAGRHLVEARRGRQADRDARLIRSR